MSELSSETIGTSQRAVVYARHPQYNEHDRTTVEEQRRKVVSRFGVPRGRFGNPEEFGAWCAMFCSQYAEYVVGQSLVLDGGLINGLF